MVLGIGKKVKKGLGKVANTVADKFIPKELAPFLPMLAPAFMGPGAGIMSRYLMPQLLAALSTGKTSGDISGTGQALAGLGSFLSDPSRMAIGEKEIKAIEGVDEVKGLPNSTIEGTEAVTMGTIDPTTGQFVPDPNRIRPSYNADDGIMRVRDLPRNYTVDGQKNLNIIEAQKLDPSIGRSPGLGGGEGMYMALPDSGIDTIGYGAGQIDPRLASEVITTPGVTAVPAGVEKLYTLAELEDAGQKASFLDYLKVGGNEARDFIQGTNVANKAPGGDQVTVGKDSQTIGKQNIDIYNKDYQNALRDRDFSQIAYKDPALMQTGAKYAAGDPMLVRDANFGYNMPRRAVQTGIATLGPTMNKIDRMKQEAAEQEALFQSNLDAYGDAKDNFYDFFANAKPNYDLLYGGGYADGGRIGAKDGKFFGSELLGANQISDEPMIGLPESIYDTDEAYSLSEDGFAVDPDAMRELGIKGLLKRILSASATRSLYNAFTGGDMNRERLGKDMNMGGRVGLNMGGMGSIPQTPAVPDGMQLDGRGGGFIPMGAQERKDDVPAMLAKNEFVMTADAVRAAGGGSVEKGAQRMYDTMNQLEAQV